MRSMTLLIVCVLVQGCSLFQAPPEVQVLTPVAGSEIKHYQRKMGGVAISATDGWEKSESTRVRDNHWRRLASFDKEHRDAFKYVYVKAQTIVLLDKLSKISSKSAEVKFEIEKLNIHIDRAIQILELFNEWMKTGFTKGDAEAVKKFFEEKSEEWLKLERDKALVELDKKVAELNAQIEASEEEAKAAEAAPPAGVPSTPEPR